MILGWLVYLQLGESPVGRGPGLLRQDTPAAVDPDDPGPVSSSDSRAEVTSTSEPVAVASTIARDFLAEFYGADWHDIEKRIPAERLDRLGQFLRTPEELPPPWSEVEADIGARLAEEIAKVDVSNRVLFNVPKWPDPLTREFWAQELGIPVGDVDPFGFAAAQLVAEEFTWRVEETMEALTRECIVEGERKWLTGDYLKFPLLVHHDPDPHARSNQAGFAQVSTRYRGWVVYYTLHHGEHPEAERLAKEAQVLAAERGGKAISAYRRESR